ncbi:hypothetical protein MUK42_27058 [Musa troglodytarum]|uniref:Uncharacterized protein n=1 Tax=Musa troglodytarum TaxID=320322 RepID=A0A9E7GEH5_9LILI|nr:hypothetical protein MUK42_27058 [Musa troglodytarum]
MNYSKQRCQSASKLQDLNSGEDTPPAYNESMHQRKDCTSQNPWGQRTATKKQNASEKRRNQTNPILSVNIFFKL